MFHSFIPLIRTSVLFLLLFIISCAVNPVTGEREFMIVSEAQELRIGKESAPSLKWEFGGQYHDPELESYLGDIVLRLWQNSERPHLPVKFYIQNTSLPNAFALPGYVAITRGLLSDMENEAQFASVMGHEIGHVMARHTAQRLSRMQLQQFGLAIGAAALEGKKGSDALMTVGAIGSSLLLLKYDRGQEIQSDRLGVRYMSMHGYDPNEAKSAHRVLERSVDNYLKRLGKSRSEDTLISTLLSTHPRKEVRTDEIQEMIDRLPPYTLKEDGKFGRRFLTATKKMRETNKIYHKYDKAEMLYQQEKFDEAEKVLKEAIKLNSSQPAFYNLLGFIKLHNKTYPEAKKQYQKALSIEPDYQPSVYGMGLAHYFGKDYDQATQSFQKSLKLFPNHAPTYLVMGKSYFELKQYSKALPYLRKFAKAAPRHSEVHGLIGICFDKRAEMESAVIGYRNQLKVAPDTELGRHAKKRLAVLEPLLDIYKK
jgi:predicted Zn-dependent protease